MNLWLIEPRDPLIFRDGKPFSAIPGARAKSLPFPLPSTVAGGVRENAGTDKHGHFELDRIDELLQTHVVGPLLVELNTENAQLPTISNWLLPAPSDALIFQDKSSLLTYRYCLQPLHLPDAAKTNDIGDLNVVGTVNKVSGKPPRNLPRYWNWIALKAWLHAPDDGEVDDLAELGHGGPIAESRMHLKINKDTQTAEEGNLFQTSGLEFNYVAAEPKSKESDKEAEQDPENGQSQPPSPQTDGYSLQNQGQFKLSRLRTLALAVQTDAKVRSGPGTLGGERRIIHWRKSAQPTQFDISTCPSEIREQILKDKACRLMLLTPAIFEKGYLPTWVYSICDNVKATVIGAAVNRYQGVSGWDYEKHAPKPSRRLAPSGSVYFLKLDGEDAAINEFIDTIWMRNISDNEQDRLDGFGLAILGTWSGKLQSYNANEEASS